MDWMFEVGPAPTDPMSDTFGSAPAPVLGGGSALDELIMDHDRMARQDEQSRLEEMAAPVAVRDADLVAPGLSASDVANDYGDEFYLNEYVTGSTMGYSASEAPTTPPPLGAASVMPSDPFTGGGGPQHIFWNGGGGTEPHHMGEIEVTLDRSSWEQRMEAQRRLDEWMTHIGATNPQLAHNLGFGGYVLDPALPVNDYLERWWQEAPPVMSDGHPDSEAAAAQLRPHIATVDARIDALHDDAIIKLPDGREIRGADLKVAWHSMSFKITTGVEYGPDRSGRIVNGTTEIDANASNDYVGWGADGAYFLIFHELSHNTIPGKTVDEQQFRKHESEGGTHSGYNRNSDEFVYNEAWANTSGRAIGDALGLGVETDPNFVRGVFGFLP